MHVHLTSSDLYFAADYNNNDNSVQFLHFQFISSS